MIADEEIGLAVGADAGRIADMSRGSIESGLGWSWTPDRVMKSIRNADTCIPVVREGEQLLGFGIMNYKADEGHLLLLAVRASHRRKGIGVAIMAWLEATALTAGVGLIYLEARKSNCAARAFYRKLGYKEITIIRGYYQGREDCVRIGKDLWARDSTHTA